MLFVSIHSVFHLLLLFFLSRLKKIESLILFHLFFFLLFVAIPTSNAHLLLKWTEENVLKCKTILCRDKRKRTNLFGLTDVDVVVIVFSLCLWKEILWISKTLELWWFLLLAGWLFLSANQWTIYECFFFLFLKIRRKFSPYFHYLMSCSSGYW